MSVPKSERADSVCAFLDQAITISFKVADMGTRLPARWRDNRTAWLYDSALRLQGECARANAIWVRTQEDGLARLAHLREAKAECYALQGIISHLVFSRPTRPKYLRDETGKKVFVDGEPMKVGDVPCVSEGYLADISDAIEEEHRLLGGAVRAEEKRLAGLQSLQRSTL